MKCMEANQALLIAEIDELRGTGDTALAAHIRECTACRMKAARILEANALLASELSTAVPGKARARRVMPVWLPIALAAAFAGVMLVDTTETIAPPRIGNLDDVKTPVTTTRVNAQSGQDVAVFQVNEKVTVVWNLRAVGGS